MGIRSRSELDSERELSIAGSLTWHPDAACQRSVLRDWFTADVVPDMKRAAMRSVCGSCPVFFECDEFASATRPRSGFWAGLFRGSKIPADLRDNPQTCPVDAQGKSVPVLLITSLSAHPEIDEVESAVSSKRLVAIRCDVGTSRPVSDCVELVVCSMMEVDAVFDFVAVSRNEDIMVYVTDCDDVSSLRHLFGENVLSGPAKTVAAQVARSLEGRRAS